ncbi:MAG: GIY-YIG nuclease family protein [Gammaproteobacteria bacterium]|nr:GIY-YIG nuclease family protein [Gammaproteobacteria bacterium]
MQSRPGTYVLVLRCNKTMPLAVGRWGTLQVRPGTYLYVGSAFGPGGVAARVSRHCRGSVARHWHIDYLRAETVLESAWFSHVPDRLEHSWAAALGDCADWQAVTGFGCSDCRCVSHLFFATGAMPSDSPLPALGPGVQVWTCAGDADRQPRPT